MPAHQRDHDGGCTVLITCLPTYAQAGMAAPILLALLRALQGLAMGGELVVLSTSIQYVHRRTLSPFWLYRQTSLVWVSFSVQPGLLLLLLTYTWEVARDWLLPSSV
jgi:MFS family permease